MRADSNREDVTIAFRGNVSWFHYLCGAKPLTFQPLPSYFKIFLWHAKRKIKTDWLLWSIAQMTNEVTERHSNKLCSGVNLAFRSPKELRNPLWQEAESLNLWIVQTWVKNRDLGDNYVVNFLFWNLAAEKRYFNGILHEISMWPTWLVSHYYYT